MRRSLLKQTFSTFNNSKRKTKSGITITLIFSSYKMTYQTLPNC